MALTLDDGARALPLTRPFGRVEDKPCIYKITSPSGKVYIGRALHPRNRAQRYICLDCKTQTGLFRSFNKHGVGSHTFSILYTYDYAPTPTEIAIEEQNYINLYKACGYKLLNLIGSGISGRMSQETRNRIGDSVRGERNGNWRRKFSKEHLQRMSASLKGLPGYWKGKKLPAHVVEFHRNRLLGKPSPKIGSKLSEETKLRISQTKRSQGLKLSPENRAKLKLGAEAYNLKKRRPIYLYNSPDLTFFKKFDCANHAKDFFELKHYTTMSNYARLDRKYRNFILSYKSDLNGFAN